MTQNNSFKTENKMLLANNMIQMILRKLKLLKKRKLDLSTNNFNINKNMNSDLPSLRNQNYF